MRVEANTASANTPANEAITFLGWRSAAANLVYFLEVNYLKEHGYD